MAHPKSVLDFIRNQFVEANAGGLSDRELLQRFAAQRDEGAFKALLRRHGPMVLRVCQRVLGRREDAEDVFQATFLVLARKAGAADWRESVAAWLYGVAHHLAQTARRKDRRRYAREARTPVAPPRSVEDSLAEMSVSELLTILDEEMASLPEPCRAALLGHLDGESGEVAARRLGCSLRTFQRRLRDARERLQKQLRRRGITLSTMALSALLLQQHMASASVPIPLVTFTAQMASLVAAGKPLAEGLVSAPVLALVQEATRAMFLRKAKILFFTFLLAGGLTAGVGAVAQHGLTQKSAAEQASLAPAPRNNVPKPETKKALAPSPLVIEHKSSVQSLAWSADCRWLATGTKEGTIRIVEMHTGKEVRRFSTGKTLTALAFSPDGKLLAVSQADEPRMSAWDLATGKLWSYLAPQLTDHAADELAFTPDGRQIVGSGFRRYLVWVPAAGQVETCSGYGLKMPLDPTDPLDDGCAGGAPDGSVSGWFQPNGPIHLRHHQLELTAKVQLIGDRVRCMAFNPSGKLLAVSRGGGVQLWDWTAEQKTRKPGEELAFRVLYTADGGRRPAAPKKTLTLTDLKEPAVKLSFSADGRTLAGLAADAATIQVWDLRDGRARDRITHRGPAKTLALSPDGRMLATLGEDNKVRVWDVAARGQPRRSPSSPDP